MLKNFLRDEQGQDLVEYTLLLAFVAIASAAIFMQASSSITQVWSKASGQLVNAAAQGS